MPSAERFFPSDRVIVLAHRGLTQSAPENTLSAFRRALAAGADVLECDVRASRDGVAVIAHDETLTRVFGDDRRVADVKYEELSRLGASRDTSVIAVADALRAFPRAKFNIDVKSSDVIGPLARAISQADAQARVLITSFSARRRRKTLRLLPGVATSASVEVVLPAVFACAIGLPWLARWLSRRTPVLQIPTTILSIDVSRAAMVTRFHRAGFLVQFWTINSPDEMIELVRRGADGIVTDRCDVAVATLRHG